MTPALDKATLSRLLQELKQAADPGFYPWRDTDYYKELAERAREALSLVPGLVEERDAYRDANISLALRASREQGGREQAESLITELTAALKPFADLADQREARDPMAAMSPMSDGLIVGDEVSLGDCRKARAALKGTPS